MQNVHEQHAIEYLNTFYAQYKHFRLERMSDNSLGTDPKHVQVIHRATKFVYLINIKEGVIEYSVWDERDFELGPPVSTHLLVATKMAAMSYPQINFISFQEDSDNVIAGWAKEFIDSSDQDLASVFDLSQKINSFVKDRLNEATEKYVAGLSPQQQINMYWAMNDQDNLIIDPEQSESKVIAGLSFIGFTPEYAIMRDKTTGKPVTNPYGNFYEADLKYIAETLYANSSDAITAW